MPDEMFMTLPERETLAKAIETISIDFKVLAEEILENAANLERNRELFEERVRDVVDLTRAAERFVEGRPLSVAFGAPGDWGYDHPIGKALAALYRMQKSVAKSEAACASSA